MDIVRVREPPVVVAIEVAAIVASVGVSTTGLILGWRQLPAVVIAPRGYHADAGIATFAAFVADQQPRGYTPRQVARVGGVDDVLEDAEEVQSAPGFGMLVRIVPVLNQNHGQRDWSLRVYIGVEGPRPPA